MQSQCWEGPHPGEPNEEVKENYFNFQDRFLSHKRHICVRLHSLNCLDSLFKFFSCRKFNEKYLVPRIIELTLAFTEVKDIFPLVKRRNCFHVAKVWDDISPKKTYNFSSEFNMVRISEMIKAFGRDILAERTVGCPCLFDVVSLHWPSKQDLSPPPPLHSLGKITSFPYLVYLKI